MGEDTSVALTANRCCQSLGRWIALPAESRSEEAEFEQPEQV